jgi:hypothetical protein
MRAVKRWKVDIFLGEDDGSTYAEARLHTEIGDSLLGIGHARVSARDADVPEIGDELAVARALNDLGHRLLLTAAGDIAQVTGDEAVKLSH